MENRTLVLTRSYVPHLVTGWITAVGLIFKGKVEVVEEYPGKDNLLGRIPACQAVMFPEACRAYPGRSGGDLIIQVPAVVRLRTWEGGVKRGVKFSRTNVYMRDGYRCQYCGASFRPADLNYDHLVPRNQGGKTVWENIVTSCYPCNNRKANRTPEQAGMRLRRRPVKPKHLPMATPRVAFGDVHELWAPYFPDEVRVA